jgi:radical SAM protein with 4Fe4S-binding SPASM domain
MAFKQFFQSLFERVGLAEPPSSPPQAADVSLDSMQQLQPVFARLADWGVKRVQLVAGEQPDAEDLLQATRCAAQLGLSVGVRGRASELAIGRLLADLAGAGAGEIEIPLLSTIAEVHDALAGAGDHRNAMWTIETAASLKLRLAVQLVLVPSTWKTIERTLQLLDDRGVYDVRVFGIVCRDDEPSNWALSAGQLTTAARSLEQSAPEPIKLAWYPPLRFNPARTLAQQVRCGPRAAAGAVRIEPDGRLFLPSGSAVPVGNMLREDWKSIARGESVRAWKRRREEVQRCAECRGLEVCARGCLRDAETWAGS